MSKFENVDEASMEPIVHTPGPWRYYDIYAGEYQEVFGPRSPGSDDRLQVVGKGDAKLIAAAPDLLEALRKIASLDYTHGATNFAAYDAVHIAKQALTKVV